jgi:hypothetical protein
MDRQTTIWLCHGMHVGLLGIGNSYVMSGFDLGWMELFWTCSSVPIRLKRQRNGLDTTSVVEHTAVESSIWSSIIPVRHENLFCGPL